MKLKLSMFDVFKPRELRMLESAKKALKKRKKKKSDEKAKKKTPKYTKPWWKPTNIRTKDGSATRTPRG